MRSKEELVVGISCCEKFLKGFERLEIKMRNALKMKTLALGLLALLAMFGASSAQAQMSYYLELSTGWNPNKGGDDLEAGLFAAGSYKFSDDWSAALESSTDFPLVTKGNFDVKVSHGFLRVPVIRKNLNWIPGWKTSLTGRWALPTNSKAHQAGGWGSFMLRPAFSKDWKPVNLTIRPSVNVALTDRSYEKYVLPGKAPKGVALFSWLLEVYPQITLSEGLDFQIYTGISQAYVGGSPTNKAKFDVVNFSYELSLTNPWVIGGCDSRIGLENKTTFDKNFNIFDSKKAVVNFYISRSF
jgi:hypothetical protein